MQADPILSDTRPFRRRVFYIPGYDPVPPRRYRELYRSEAALQARMQGYQVALHGKTGGSAFGWKVIGQIEGQCAEAEIEVLVWADIVQGSMAAGIGATYLQLARTAWAYIGSGALFRLMRLRKGPVIAALYPIVFLLVQLGLAILVGGALFLACRRVLPGWAGTALGAALAVATVLLMLRWFRALDNRIFAYYLMHDYAFTARNGGAIPAELETRMAEFGARIRAALTGSELDEVLVVGHSSGVHLAVSILADLLRTGLPDRRPELSFLSLGHVVPMAAFLPGADRLRRDLRLMSEQDQIPWVDVTAPGDGCAFALCDPVAVTGVATERQLWPLILSAAFTQTLSPARWKALRWRFFRLHFQYLCAFDALPGRTDDYDYFRITAGPLTLWQRYAGRPPSKSRITRAVNRHTGTLP